MEWLKNAWNGLLNVLEEVGEIIEGLQHLLGFASVPELITNTGLAMFTTLLSGLASLIINTACGVVESIGTAVVGCFAPNIGDGASAFETLFGTPIIKDGVKIGGSLDWVIRVFEILGFVILAYILIASLFKMIMSPTPSTDSPLGLVFSVIGSGVAIYYAPTFIFWVEKIICVFYNELASIFGTDFSELRFDFFSAYLQSLISEGTSVFTSTDRAAQMLLILIITLVLLVRIAFKFVGFCYEIALRYVIMAVLYVTSPAAFAFAASKTTRTSFAKWVRMIASQLLLLLFNVVFLAVFFRAINTFTATYANAFGDLSLTGIFIWCLLCYGILHIGTKVDTYLCSLGLNVAQVGSVMMVSALSDLIETGQLYLDKGGRFSVRNPSSVPGGIYSHIKNHGKAPDPKGIPVSKIVQQNSDGSYKVSSLIEAINKMQTADKITGVEAGRAIANNIRGIPRSVMGTLDPSTCVVKRGCISISTGSAKGPVTTFTFVPKSMITSLPNYSGKDSSNINELAARQVKIDGVDFLAFPHGQTANKFLSENRKMASHLNSKCGNFTQIKKDSVSSDKKVHTGIYVATEHKKDGGAVVHEYIPLTLYTPHSSKAGEAAPSNSQYVSCEIIGGIPYAHFKKEVSPQAVPIVRTQGVTPTAATPEPAPLSSVDSVPSAHAYEGAHNTPQKQPMDGGGTPRLQSAHPTMPDWGDAAVSEKTQDEWFRKEFPAANFDTGRTPYHPYEQIKVDISKWGIEEPAYITRLARDSVTPDTKSEEFWLIPNSIFEISEEAKIVGVTCAQNGTSYSIVLADDALLRDGKLTDKIYVRDELIPGTENQNQEFVGFEEKTISHDEIHRILSASEVQRGAYEAKTKNEHLHNRSKNNRRRR